MKSTKKSLVLSVLSLLLCISMLLGTTYAWFTDSVTSGVNKIVAGNLDVDAEYSIDGTNWSSLDNADTLFSSSLWEPGHTEIVYLRVVNKGTLAFNYRVNVTPIEETGGVNQAGDSFKLSDYMCFKTNTPTIGGTLETYADRPSARAIFTTGEIQDAVDGKSTMLTQVQTSSSRTGVLYAKNDTDNPVQYYATMAMVVYMPEDVGNEANYMTGTQAPEIKLGVTIYAWQEDYEIDSFDKNYDSLDEFDALNPNEPDIGTVDYDYYPQISQVGNVLYDEGGNVKNAGVSDAEGTVTITSTEKVDSQPAAKIQMKVNSTSDANASGTVKLNVYKDEAGNGTFQANASSNSIDLTEKETKTYEVNVTTEGVTVAPENAYIVDMFIGKNLKNVEMWHNTNNSGVLTKMTENPTSRDALVAAALDNTFYYNSETGVVTLYAKALCPFSAVYDKAVAVIGTTRYYTLEEAAKAAKSGDTISLIKDVDLTDRTEFYELNFEDNVTLNLQGYTVTSKNGGVVYQGKDLTIENGKFVAADGGSYALFIGNGTETTKVTLDEITCVGGINVYYAYVDIVDTSAIGVAGTNYYAVWGDAGANIDIESGVFTTEGNAVLGNSGYVASGSEDNSWIRVWGGTFTAPENKDVFLEGDSWIILYGGTYNQNPDKLANNDNVYYNFGYIVNDNGNGTWTVQPANIGTTYFSGGNGTEAEPYLVSDASQWRWVNYIGEGYYKLTADLDFTDVTYNAYSVGDIHIDGNEKTIKNNTAPLFGNWISGTVNIKNLTFVDCTSDYSLISRCGGYDGDFTFTNVDATKCVCKGGAAFLPWHYAWEATSSVSFKDCDCSGMTVSDDVASQGYVAGFVGNCNKTASIINCTFGGTITSNNRICGGFVGSTYAGTISGSTIKEGTVITQKCGSAVSPYGGASVTDCSFAGKIISAASSQVNFQGLDVTVWEAAASTVKGSDFTIVNDGTVTYTGTDTIAKVKVYQQVTIDRLYNGTPKDGGYPYTIESAKEFTGISSENNTMANAFTYVTNIRNVAPEYSESLHYSVTKLPSGLEFNDYGFALDENGVLYLDSSEVESSSSTDYFSGTYQADKSSVTVTVFFAVYDSNNVLVSVVSNSYTVTPSMP